MQKKLHKITRFQLLALNNRCKRMIMVAGRGSGKTRYIGMDIYLGAEEMPGASFTLTGKTYNHVLTGMLPSALAQLEEWGYFRNKNLIVGTRPPTSWGLPYEPPERNFEHYITMFHPKKPVGIHLISQDRKGSARGMNTDREILDEFINIDWEQYNQEVHATNRANRGRYNYPCHNGFLYTSSMPYSKENKEIFKHSDYYYSDYGLNYIEGWKRIVEMQMLFLDLVKTGNKTEIAKYWNEIAYHQNKFLPRKSKDEKTFFAFSNAFDNLENVGLSYIQEQQATLPSIIFLIEIMNMPIDTVEDCYYAIQKDLQIYYDNFDRNILESKNQFNKMNDCRFDSRKQYNPNEPLIMGLDWGGRISYSLICQNRKEDEWDTLYAHKEFFVKPPGEMINRLMQQFCEYYHYHNDKRVFFIRDKYGDDSTGKINSSKTYNEQAIDYLTKHGWRVMPKEHYGKEPPYHKKWQLMSNILKENNPKFLRLRINGNNCKYLLVSMDNTRIREVNNKMEKDKSDERNKNIAQETAQHPGDCLDKICYTLNHLALESSGGGLSTMRFSKKR